MVLLSFTERRQTRGVGSCKRRKEEWLPLLFSSGREISYPTRGIGILGKSIRKRTKEKHRVHVTPLSYATLSSSLPLTPRSRRPLRVSSTVLYEADGLRIKMFAKCRTRETTERRRRNEFQIDFRDPDGKKTKGEKQK